MDDLERKEERNKRIGWITAVSVQLVLLVLFYFLIAWKAPNPPIPEYGIELGFTTSAGASSSTPPPQAESEAITEEEVSEEAPETSNVEEVVESEAEEPSESDTEALEEIVAEEVDSPVPVEETETAQTESESVEEEVLEDIQPTEEPVEKEEDKQEDEKPTEESIEEPNTGEGQGEEEEEPVIDQRALYGSQGNSEGSDEGASLSLAGWVWDFKPKPEDNSDETGKIVYKIVVDGDGYLVKIEVVTRTVSSAVERKYRQAVEKLTFSKTEDYKAAPLSTGTLTFIITSK